MSSSDQPRPYWHIHWTIQGTTTLRAADAEEAKVRFAEISLYQLVDSGELVDVSEPVIEVRDERDVGK